MGGGEVARYLSRHDGRNITHAALISSVVPYMLKTPDNPDGVDKERLTADLMSFLRTEWDAGF